MSDTDDSHGDGDRDRGERRRDRAGRPNRRSVLRGLGAAGVGVGLPAAAASGVSQMGGVTDPPNGSAGNESAGEGSGDGSGRKTFECYRFDQQYEVYGPTDVNAQSGNQGLSVALNDVGTMTVFKWPRPSFYDQIKYFTIGRDDDGDIQTRPNTGSFLGLAVETGGTGATTGGDGGENGNGTTWLREWDAEQRYGHDLSDEVVTEYRNDDLGLSVAVADVVAPDEDALVRRVRVERDADSPVARARLVSFENFNLVVSKYQRFPTKDWCEESQNTDRARYDGDRDAVVHTKSGVDVSTDERQSVAVAMGLGSASGGHQVGGDAHEPAASPAGESGRTQDAYEDAKDGELRGNDAFDGQTTGALSTPLSFDDGPATETVVFAAAEDAAGAGEVLDGARTRLDADGFAGLREDKRAWFADLLGDAPLPDTDDEDVLKLAKRALVTLVTDYEPENGSVVASIATQSPYGVDWPRDGAYFNYVFDLLGLHDWVRKHNRWYTEVQQTEADPRPSHPRTPPGNWAMNYYSDGIAGGPIPYEIDETGYGIWTMWDHYTVVGDEAYLREMYPAIERAADHLVTCKEPETELQCPATEDDHFFNTPTQSITGASLVWLGLRSAARAARELGRGADADRYEARQHELGQAIDEYLYDAADGESGGEGAYGTKSERAFPGAHSEVVWPVCFTPYTDPETGELRDEPQVENPFDHPRIQSHLDTDYREAATAFAEPAAGERDSGLYQAKALIPLAKARREDSPGSLAQVREGLRWIATHHATSDTHVMGEVWKVFENEAGEREVRSIISQPHAWEQVLFYLASLEAHPPKGVDFESTTCGSVLDALRRSGGTGGRGPGGAGDGADGSDRAARDGTATERVGNGKAKVGDDADAEASDD